VAGLEGIDARLGADLAVLIRIAGDRSRAGALAEVLKCIETTRLSLKAIHSGPSATEDAYLQLLQEYEAHGFHR
jgi:prephenate dehydratase